MSGTIATASSWSSRHRSMRMVRRNPHLQIDIRQQRSWAFVGTAHDLSLNAIAHPRNHKMAKSASEYNSTNGTCS